MTLSQVEHSFVDAEGAAHVEASENSVDKAQSTRRGRPKDRGVKRPVREYGVI